MYMRARTEAITTGLERLRSACEQGPVSPSALCDHLSEVMLGDTTIEDDVAIVVIAID